MPELGLRKEDQELLQERVSVVFHLAATVNFLSPLRFVVYTSIMYRCTYVNTCNVCEYIHNVCMVNSILAIKEEEKEPRATYVYW